MKWKLKVMGYTDGGHFTGGIFDIEATDAEAAVEEGKIAGWDCGWHDVTAIVMVAE